MGVDKAHVRVGSATMLELVVSALRGVTGEIVVVGRSESLPDVHTLPDDGAPHRGPLAGLVAAVEAFPASMLTVVAVDQPWVRATTLQRLVELTGSADRQAGFADSLSVPPEKASLSGGKPTDGARELAQSARLRSGRLPVVPVDDGVRQTTCAVYPSDALDGIRDELEGGGSIQSLLDRTSFRPVIETEWRSWDEDGRSWFSADSTNDLEDGLTRFGPP